MRSGSDAQTAAADSVGGRGKGTATAAAAAIAAIAGQGKAGWGD